MAQTGVRPAAKIFSEARDLRQRRRNALVAAAAALALAGVAPQAARAASATWNASPTNGNWVAGAGDNNWSTGVGTFPGSLNGTTNQDTATFNAATGTPAVSLNSPLNVRSILFDVAANAHTIGIVGGNALTLTTGGSIALGTTTTSFTGTAITETINAPLILGGAAYTIANNSTTPAGNLLSVGGAINGLTDYSTITFGGANTGTNLITGAIGNGSATALGVTKIGAGTWRFGTTSANSYTGPTTVTAGVLELVRSANANNAIVGNILINGGTLRITTNNNQISNTANVVMTLGTFDGNQRLETIGTATITGGTMQTGTSGQITMDALGLAGGTIIVNSGSVGTPGLISVGRMIMTSGTTTMGGGTTANNLRIGTGGLILGDASANTTLNTPSGGSATTTGQLLLLGDVTTVASSGLTSINLDTGSNFTVGSVGSGGVNLNGTARTFFVNDGSASIDLSMTSPIVNGSLIKAGGGTMATLNKNTYTGTTTVAGGTLIVDSNYTPAAIAGAQTYTDNASNAALTVHSGTVQVKGRTNGTAATLTGSTWGNGSNVITTTGGTAGLAPGQTITFSGSGFPAGTIYVTSVLNGTQFTMNATTTAANGVASTVTVSTTNSATSSQTFNGLTIGGSAVVDVLKNGGNGTTIDLRGAGAALVNRLANATVDFRSTGSSLNTTDTVIKVANLNDPTGIIGAWATANAIDLAAVDGSNNVIPYTGYTNIDAQGSVIPDGAAANVRMNAPGVSGTVGLGAAVTNINTLLQGTTTAATVDTGGNTLRVAPVGAVIVGAGQAALTIGTAANSGTLTAGGTTPDAAGELLLTNHSTNPLTINSTVADNGAGAVTLVKSGTGPLVLAGNNTHTGGTHLTAGSTAIAGNANLGAAAAPLVLNGGTLTTTTAFSLTDGVTPRAITLGTSPSTINTTPGATATLTVPGVISGTSPTGTLIKAGSTGAVNGNLLLTGTNTYVGQTIITGGSLIVGSSTAAGNSPLGSTAGGTTVIAGDVQLANGVTVSGEAITINGAGSGTFGAIGTVPATAVNATWAGPVVLGSTGARIGADIGGTLNLTGVIDDGPLNFDLIFSARVGGATGPLPIGVVVLGNQNTYGGLTKVTRGTVRLGVDNALPVGTVVDIHDNTGTTDASLLDLNANDQTVAGIQRSFAATTASITNLQSGPANLSTLTVVGTVAASTYAGTLDGNLALTKSGPQSLTLSAASNSYTGSTTVTGGSLILSAAASTNNILSSSTINVGPTAASGPAAILNVTGLSGGQIGLAFGQTLKGFGTVTGGVALGLNSTIAPGGSIGTLTTGNQEWNQGGIYQFELSRDGGGTTTNDLLNILGTVTAVPALTGDNTPENSFIVVLNRLDTAPGFTFPDGTTFSIAQTSTPFTGTLVANDNIFVNDGGFQQWDVTVTTLGAGSSINITVVPEPGAFALLGLAAAAGTLRRRRMGANGLTAQH